jgi:acyl carrier protein
MMNEEIKEKVFAIVERVFNVNSKQLTLEMKKEDFETWDSIGNLQFVMNLESDFGIKLKTAEINNIKGIEDCISLIEKHIG